MRLRITALLAVLGLATLFAFKGLGTVWPELLQPLPLARASASALLAASVGMLVFFATLRSRLREGGRRALAFAASIGMAGAGIGALVDLRELLVSVDLARVSREAAAAGHLGELASAVALLWFFVVIRRRARGTGLAIAGSSLLVGLALAIFVLDVSGLGLGWLVAWSYTPALALAVLAVTALSGLARFFVLLALDPSPLAG